MDSNTFKAVIIDLDGTVYLSEQCIDGARGGIETLRAAGLSVIFLTNNPIKPRETYQERLRSLGIEAAYEEIVTSSSIAATFLASHHPDATVFVIGEAPLVAELQNAGIEVTDDPKAVDIVLASMDRSFGYNDLRDVLVAFDEGSVSRFYATNPDRTCPTNNGPIPDAAAMIGAIEGMTGQNLDAVLGKPSKLAAETAIERLGETPSDCLVIGDRLETDVRMGRDVGMSTVLVLSGATNPGDVPTAAVQPDYVLDSLGQIESVIQQ
jgi:HAD superfamily hydrolase (TIGR01450 family)